MYNLTQFYNEFSDLASLVREPMEAKTKLPCDFGEGEIEITLKFIPSSVRDGDPILFFRYNKKLDKAQSWFYISTIKIPSGQVISKKTFTAKKIHIDPLMTLAVSREDGFKWKAKVKETMSCNDDEVFVVRKLRPEEIKEYNYLRGLYDLA